MSDLALPPAKKIKLDELFESSSAASLHAVDESDSDVPKKRSDGKKLVEKGSLNLNDLLEAKKRAKMRKDQDDATEEDKKEERRAANRLSAFQSRERRKLIIEDLRKTVAQLAKDNSEQRSELAQMKIHLEHATKENEFLRSQIAAHYREQQPAVVPPAPSHPDSLWSFLPTSTEPQPALTPSHPELASLLRQLADVQGQMDQHRAAASSPTVDLASLLQSLHNNKP